MSIQARERVIVVTGASSGLGRLTAETLAAGGSLVYATMRGSLGSRRSAWRRIN